MDTYLRSLELELGRLLRARTGGSRGETGAGLVELPGQDRIRRSFAGMRWFLRRSLRHSPETPPAEEGLADPPTLASALEDLARSVLRGVREMDGLASQTHETRFLQQQVESLIFIWRFARALSARPARDGVELHEVLYPRAWDMPGGYADPHDSTFVLDKHVPWGNGPYMHQPVRGRRILRGGPPVWGRSGAQPSQRGRYERAASWDRTPAPASAPARGGDLRLTLRETLFPWGDRDAGSFHQIFSQVGFNTDDIFATKKVFDSVLERSTRRLRDGVAWTCSWGSAGSGRWTAWTNRSAGTAASWTLCTRACRASGSRLLAGEALRRIRLPAPGERAHPFFVVRGAPSLLGGGLTASSPSILRVTQE